jgi:hypothetical protein
MLHRGESTIIFDFFSTAEEIDSKEDGGCGGKEEGKEKPPQQFSRKILEVAENTAWACGCAFGTEGKQDMHRVDTV